MKFKIGDEVIFDGIGHEVKGYTEDGRVIIDMLHELGARPRVTVGSPFATTEKLLESVDGVVLK